MDLVSAGRDRARRSTPLIRQRIVGDAIVPVLKPRRSTGFPAPSSLAQRR